MDSIANVFGAAVSPYVTTNAPQEDEDRNPGPHYGGDISPRLKTGFMHHDRQ
jgi:hypothetical protein